MVPTEFSLGQWTSRRREERDSEFAPPTTYFTDEKRTNQARSGQDSWGKGKHVFKWSERQGVSVQGSTERQTQNVHTHLPFMGQHTSTSQPQQNSQAQSVDDLLSFYKNSV